MEGRKRMKEVSIYIATSINGPWNRDGWIGYCLEYYPEGKKYARTLIDYEQVFDMNQNRAEQEALIRAFTRFRENCILSIYTDSEYLYNGFAGAEYVDKWIKNGWLTAKGQEVKNKDKWMELLKALQGNMYMFFLKQNNAYTLVLQDELKRRESKNV